MFVVLNHEIRYYDMDFTRFFNLNNKISEINYMSYMVCCIWRLTLMSQNPQRIGLKLTDFFDVFRMSE